MAKADNPFRWFDSSPEVIQLVVMLYERYPLSPRNVEDLAFERGVDICHETVRKWVNRFGPMFAVKGPNTTVLRGIVRLNSRPHTNLVSAAAFNLPSSSRAESAYPVSPKDPGRRAPEAGRALLL